MYKDYNYIFFMILFLIILLIFIIIFYLCKKDKFVTDKPILGRFIESSYPHISNDFWYEIVNNEISFFLRSHENSKNKINLIKFLNNKKSKINIIINNQLDISLLNEKLNIILEHKNLNKLYITNPIIVHKKIEPIPIGLKWQFKSTNLYGESKQNLLNIYNSIAKSTNDIKKLFYNTDKINKIMIRPMANSNCNTKNYIKNNNALKTARNDIYNIIKNNQYIYHIKEKLNLNNYLKLLTKYRFVISPAGNGLDSHSTYEALLCGCIPIVPKSTLSKLYVDLPVLQINDWKDLNNLNIDNLIDKMLSKEYNFDKMFYDYWKITINKL